MTLAFRDAEEADLPLVIGSWLSSFRCAHAAGMISMGDWHDVMTRQIERVIARPDCHVIVAYNPDEDDKRLDLHGWLCFERHYQVMQRVHDARGRWVEQLVETDTPLIHYCFVKQAFRRLGIARALLKAAKIDPARDMNYTCRTSAVTKLASKVPRAKWHPLIARFEKHPKTQPTTQRGQHAEASTSQDHPIP